MNTRQLTFATKLAVCLVLFTLAVGAAWATTYTIPLPLDGGILTYTVTTNIVRCILGSGSGGSYSESVFTSFSYTDSSGTTTPLSGEAQGAWGAGTGSCFRFIEPGTFITPSFEIVFTPTGGDDRDRCPLSWHGGVGQPQVQDRRH